MARATIDFGIDLGTTNSAIACVDQGEAIIIKNNWNNEVTPSVVRIPDARGTIMVGASAYNMLESDPENTCGEFKRWIGSDATFTFAKSGRKFTAEQLSAEVLKSLKNDVNARYQEDVQAAVITVPAMFEIPRCEATRKAAKLAGIEFTPLLQEPIAAAVSYGFQAEAIHGILMVFDLGGGTFDVSLLSAREGRLIVLGHDGDNKLGGKDFDWKLVELLANRLAKNFGGPVLNRHDPAARNPLARLKRKAEDAKKELSAREVCLIDVSDLGPDFVNVNGTVEITRREYENLIEPDIEKAISICERVLRDNKLAPSAIEAVILVGGPTLTPHIRATMFNRLRIRPEVKVDPLTVVARGAAIFASQQRLPSLSSPVNHPGKFNLHLAYSPVCDEEDTDIGIVMTPIPTDSYVKVLRSDGGWSSGALPVPSNGKIIITVTLRPKKLNEFRIQLEDNRGNSLPVEPSQFTITHGVTAGQATTSRSFGVALEGNEYQIVIAKGSPLPAKATRTFKSVTEIAAGSKENVLKVYILEGDSKRADRNIEIGLLEMSGEQCRRSLPAGEDVEIEFCLNASRELSARAFIPFLNQTLDNVIPYGTRISSNLEDIQRDLVKEEERLGTLRGHVDNQRAIACADRDLEEVRKDIMAADVGDPDVAQKALVRLLELKAELDPLEEQTEWVRLVQEFESDCEGARGIVLSCGTSDDKRQLDFLIEEANVALKKGSVRPLRAKVDSISQLRWKVIFAQNEFWIAQYHELSKPDYEFVDKNKSAKLIEEGSRALTRKDYESLKTIISELFHLLPSWQQSKIDLRFADAGLKRAYGQKK